MSHRNSHSDVSITRLADGSSVSKDCELLEACGTIDELNAVLGLACAQPLPAEIADTITQIQNDLFVAGADLAFGANAPGNLQIGPVHLDKLEAAIARWSQQLPPLQKFVLPAGTPAAAAINLARTVCRRAERRVVTVVRNAAQGRWQPLLAYLNRLSYLLFLLYRAANLAAAQQERLWPPPEQQP